MFSHKLKSELIFFLENSKDYVDFAYNLIDKESSMY